MEGHGTAGVMPDTNSGRNKEEKNLKRGDARAVCALAERVWFVAFSNFQKMEVTNSRLFRGRFARRTTGHALRPSPDELTLGRVQRSVEASAEPKPKSRISSSGSATERQSLGGSGPFRPWH